VRHTLVTTKLHVPRTRPDLVARPRLRDLLGAGEGRKLTLVSAPAGFGKTTLLVDWLRGRSENERSVAWLSLDEVDSDPARFLRYLIGALQSVDARLGEGVLALLRSPEPPSAQVVVGELINALAALPRAVTLVLDDYHVISTKAVHEAVAFLLEHEPDNIHLVIACRTDPPLPLAKLRARGQITELRAAELRFTPQEATAFLGDVMGLNLSPEDVAALDEVTEGWVAALQLAALSMRDRQDVGGFVRAFSGSNRHILDFLTEEVLNRQPEEVRAFLLRTSVLGRMSAPLCNVLCAALTDHAGAQRMLERLERDNLFVVPLDSERHWYRYHHLFAEFLRSRLELESPELAGELHLRASTWFEEEGLVAEAITHALAASASGADPTFERAARLVEAETKHAWGSGEGSTALGWLGALPEEAKRRHPRLLLEHALALALTGRPDDAEPYLDEAEQVAETVDSDRLYLLGLAAAIRCWCARLRGAASQAVAFGRRALLFLPDEESPHRNFAAVCLGDALRIAGDLTAASETFAEAVRLGRATGHVYGTLSGMVGQARVLTEQGRLRSADDALRQTLKFVAEEGIELLPAVGLVHIEAGVLHYERGQLEDAERDLAKGVALAERTREVSALARGYVALSKVKQAQGDEEGAFERAYQAIKVAQIAGADLETAIATAWTARLHLARGDVAEAGALEHKRTVNTGAALTGERLSAARLHHARGQHREALGLLDVSRQEVEAAGQIGLLIEVLVLQAQVLWVNSEKARAVRTLARALALAEPEGFVRTFVDEGARVGEILAAVIEARQRGRHDATDGVSARYLAKLLAALAPEVGVPSPNERLLEPLSERELEVLALIAAGKSNKEIAGTLAISTSTVKTHINNLYGKLEARSRTQALARAREKHLL